MRKKGRGARAEKSATKPTQSTQVESLSSEPAEALEAVAAEPPPPTSEAEPSAPDDESAVTMELVADEPTDDELGTEPANDLPADIDTTSAETSTSAQPKADPTATPTGEPEAAIEPPAAEAVVAAPPIEAPPAPSAPQIAAEILPIAERLRAGRCVLVAGAHLSDEQPAFRELVARLLETLPEAEARGAWSVIEQRPLAAAGFVRRRLGNRFAEELRKAAAASAELPEVVRLLGALPFRAVVTTAYDDAFDRAFVRDGHAPRIYTPRDAQALRHDGRLPFVLKALGDPARAETVVWSAEDLQAALADGAYRAAAHDLYRSRSFLFVGFDGGDPDLAILLERVLAGAPAGEVEHFAVLPGVSAVEKEELYAAYRIRVLDSQNVTELARGLRAAIGDQPTQLLPDDDDYEGWLQLLAEDHGRADALARLDQLTIELRQRGDFDHLVELLLGRVGVEEQHGRRAEMLLEVARIFEHEAKDATRAFTALIAAYKEDPQRAEWSELERVTTAANSWDSLTEEFGELEPQLPASVRAPLHRRTARWADLARTLDQQVEQASGEEARQLRSEVAELYADKLGDRAAAIDRYETLLRDTPRDLVVLRALERLYDQTGRNREYLDCLERQAEALDSDAERAPLYRRLALLWEESPGGAAPAQEAWEKLLTLEPRAEDALRALERIYRNERKWPELIQALRQRAALLPTAMRAELFVQIGALYEQELRDLDGAISAYVEVEAALPNHVDALAALTRLYEKTSQWPKVVALLERRILLAEGKAQKLELAFHAGELSAGHLGDARGAEAHFVRALELDVTHVPSMTALVEIYRKNGEFLKAAKLLVEAVPHTSNRLERTRLLVEAGEIYHGLDEQKRAIELYLEALSVDPEHVEAGERVAELLWQAGRYAELVPVLEMLTRLAPRPQDGVGRDDAERGLQVERLIRLGRAAKAAGFVDKVHKAYARAAELDPTNLEAQRGRAEHHLGKEQWTEALTALAKICQHHLEDLVTSERVQLYYDMARCELKLGDRAGAREALQRGLALDPTHRPSLLLQMELGDEEPQAVIEAKKALLATASPDEQVRLRTEIGDLYLHRLKDAPQAIAAWREALELKPEDHKLLHKCLDLYVEQKAWANALEMLERLVAVERSPSLRAKYRHAAGLICRDELGRPDVAAAHLSAALEDDATLQRSAEALEALYLERQEWKELARYYRKQLKRLGPESPGDADGKNGERLRVWSTLGEICLDKLGERESALAALEVALTFDRGNLERHKRIADLYVQAGPHAFDKAIVEHQHILRHEKNRVLSYRALKHLYIQTAQRDKSVLCSYVLEFLKKGEPDDAAKVAEYKKRPFATARRELNDDTWARLQHPDEDRLLGMLFALVAPAVAAAHAQPHKGFGLNRKEALAADDPHSYAKALKYVTSTFGVAVPEAYARAEQKEPVAFANCIDGRTLVPVFVLGAPLIGDKRQEVEQVFELARRAAHLRPERFLRLVLPQPAQLGHVIDLAMALGAEQEGGKPPTGEMSKTALGLKRALTPQQLEQVAAIGRKLRAAGTRSEAAAAAWLQASDLTALRAGLVMAGDLQTCARLIAAEPAPAVALPTTQRLLDLVWSSITEDLFAARKQLGFM
jgi:tetratricopeptide (TPR) repeat protein